MVNTKDYTNKEYLNHEKIVHELGLDEKVWEEILLYRKKNLTLLNFSNKDKMLYITQTPILVAKEAKILSDLSKLFIESHRMITSPIADTSYKDFRDEQIVDQILIILNQENLNVPKGIVLDIVRDAHKPKTSDEIRALSLYRGFRLSMIKGKTIKELNNSLNQSVGFRNQNIMDKNDKEVGIDFIKIPTEHKKLLKFNTNDDFMPITKVAINYFIQNNGLFFAKDNSLTSLLNLNLILSEWGLNEDIGIISFVGVAYAKKDLLVTAMKDVIDNDGDITYLLFAFLKIIFLAIKQTREKINEKFKNKDIEISKREKNLNIKAILRDNPRLSKRQAEFYINHKSLGKAYSIEDFREFIGASYETSRYSMDNLSNEGLYHKEKIGKKYVYICK